MNLPKLKLVHSARRSLKDCSDEVLLKACASGDELAAEIFVRRFQNDVVRFIGRSIGRDDADLPDLVQLTFVAAITSAGKIQGGSKVKTWLLGIAHNKIKHQIRTNMRRRDAHDGLHEVAPDRGPGPATETHRARMIRKLDGLVAELDPDRRIAFLLCEIEGLSGREAAHVLGLPEGTLYRRLHEARKLLRGQLGEEGS